MKLILVRHGNEPEVVGKGLPPRLVEIVCVHLFLVGNYTKHMLVLLDFNVHIWNNIANRCLMCSQCARAHTHSLSLSPKGMNTSLKLNCTT